MRSPDLILVDGSYCLYRAWHAMPALSNQQGEQTGAIFGVIRTLRELQKNHDPRYFAMVFDTPGKNFRHQIYPDYKGNRPPMPVELQAQLDPLYELLQALGVPLLRIPEVEADDVIATLAMQAADNDMSVLICTSDKDLAQLVSTQIHLYNPVRNVTLDSAGVQQKYGVSPQQIVDWLSLMGDSSDNIPGIPKVGGKTSAAWLQRYNTLAGVIQNAAEIKGVVGENLRANLQRLATNKTLVTLKTDVSLPCTPTDLMIGTTDIPKLHTLYRQLGFRRWLRELEQQNQLPEQPQKQQRQSN